MSFSPCRAAATEKDGCYTTIRMTRPKRNDSEESPK